MAEDLWATIFFRVANSRGSQARRRATRLTNTDGRLLMDITIYLILQKPSNYILSVFSEEARGQLHFLTLIFHSSNICSIGFNIPNVPMFAKPGLCDSKL